MCVCVCIKFYNSSISKRVLSFMKMSWLPHFRRILCVNVWMCECVCVRMYGGMYAIECAFSPANGTLAVRRTFGDRQRLADLRLC